jgi:hypothetical protein
VFLKRRTDDGRYLELTTMRGYNIAVYDVPAFFKRDKDGRALDFRPVRSQ